MESAAGRPDLDASEGDQRPRGKYHQSLQALKPIRFSSPRWASATWLASPQQDRCLTFSPPSLRRSHSVDNAGFLSFATFAWITPMMWAIFRNRLDLDSLELSPSDRADVNTARCGSTWAVTRWRGLRFRRC